MSITDKILEYIQNIISNKASNLSGLSGLLKQKHESEKKHESKQKRVKSKEFDEELKKKTILENFQTQANSGGSGGGWDGRGYRNGIIKTE